MDRFWKLSIAGAPPDDILVDVLLGDVAGAPPNVRLGMFIETRLSGLVPIKYMPL
jgi:hypothetical protein